MVVGGFVGARLEVKCRWKERRSMGSFDLI